MPNQARIVSTAMAPRTFKAKSFGGCTPTEKITPAAVKHSYDVLKQHNAGVKRAPVVWLDQTYDMSFVKNALAKIK